MNCQRWKAFSSLLPLSHVVVHQLSRKRNVKKRLRIIIERESRMDRQRLCPEFNRIKDQQLSRRQTAERQASRCGPCNISNNHRYTNTRCEAAYRNVNIRCVRLFEPVGYDQDLFRWAKFNLSLFKGVCAEPFVFRWFIACRKTFGNQIVKFKIKL